MKKIFALLLTLMMLFSCTSAYAVTRENFAVDGDYVWLDEVGLAMYIPSDFVSYAVSAQEAANHGTLAIMGRTDTSLMMTVAYSAVTTASGKQITTLEELAAYYMASGADVKLSNVNGLSAMTYILPAGDMLTAGLCLISTDGMVLNFCTASFNAEDFMLSYLMLLSVSPSIAE